MNSTATLGRRLRELREDLYGGNGADSLADALDIPSQTWLNFEMGVTMPAHIMLKFLDITGTNPHWLLTGEGDRLIVQIA
jgi:hypothetical protein